MAFMKVKKDTDAGILYILIMKIDDMTVYKVGVTKRKVEERVCEILTSFFITYRFFPYCYPKRFKTVDAVYNKEAEMHRLLKEYSHSFDKPFSGSTEFFTGLELEELLKIYEGVINDERS